MEERIKQKFESLQAAIGNTPLARIQYRYKGNRRHLYAKLEYYNFTGSIKDRIALYILRHGYTIRAIRPGFEISEASSGNTGIAFCALGAYLGHKVKIFIPDWLSSERKKLIKSFGAETILVSREQGGFTGSVAMSKAYASKGDVFLPLQFENEANTAAHFATTGPEIYAQMQQYRIQPDAFTAGVATGGTIMGTGLFLQTQYKNLRIFPMEPASCTTLRNGQVGPHRIQGIGDEFIPDILDLSRLDQIIDIDDGDAIIMAQKAAARLGLGIGISAGANLLSAIFAQEHCGAQHIVTVFPDDNKKYLSTDYARQEPVKPGFISTDVELEDFDLVR